MFNIKRIVIAVLALHMVHHHADAQSENRLNDYLFKNRILLIKATGTDTVSLVDKLNQNNDDLIARKLLVFLVDGNRVSGLYTPEGEMLVLTQAQLASLTDDNSVFLIGLDGGLKSAYPDLNVDAIFTEIDGMPMRRYEISNASDPN